MNCPKCGKENPDDARACQFCDWVLSQRPVSAEGVTVKTSGLTVVSFVLGIVSCVALLIAAATQVDLIANIWLITGLTAVILGVIGLVQTGLSAGRLAGRGFAAIGTALPLIVYFLLLVYSSLYRPRCVAFRMVCGSNLSGIGKAMLIYAYDYEEKLPRAGGPNSVWTGRISNWMADNRSDAYGLTDGNGEVSITASFYLLVKYEEAAPSSFVCDKERGTSEFKLSEYRVTDKELIDVWDFGPNPSKHCSYSYHIPYGPYPLTASDKPGLAVAADRNPWMDTPNQKAKDFSLFKWDGTAAQQKAGNTFVHQEDGQNVLFLDGSTRFEKRTYCGVNDDNIYTYWDGPDIKQGAPPRIGSQPADRLDSLLVHDGAGRATEPSKSRRRR